MEMPNPPPGYTWTWIPGSIHNLHDPWKIVYIPITTTIKTQAPPPATSVVTGMDPNQAANALYGKIIPLSALGLARIGTAGLIFGPYKNSGTASFAVSFGFPANVTGTRRVYEVALDGQVVWELAAGSAAGALDPSGFVSEAFTCRFYSGTLTQSADPLEIAEFGSAAVAYRPQMMLWFDSLPLAPFNDLVPFVSCKIGDTTSGATPSDGINLGEAIERVAYSPFLEYTSGTFETSGIQDIVQAMILSEDQSFISMLQNVSRVYRTLDIIQTDKLRVNDRGSTVTPDITLDRDRIVAEAGVTYTRQEESSVPRELELITIDPEQDYVFVPSKSSRPRDPVPVTSSVGKETITLPVVIGPTTRASLVTYAKYQEENARKRASLQGMLYTYEIEPGDLVAIRALNDGFDSYETFKVTETSHGANYVNEMTLEAILKCALPSEETSAEFVGGLEDGPGAPNPISPSTSHTFSSASLGVAHADRTIVVGLNLNLVSSGLTINTITINGVSATQAVVASHPDVGAISALWYAAVPTGTTGDIAITTSGNLSQITAHIYRLVSPSVALDDTGSGTATSASVMTVDVDAADGGFVVAVGHTRNGAPFVWGGVNVDSTFVNTGDTDGQSSSGSYTATAVENVVVTIDPTSAEQMTLAAAAFSL